ncbi:hypothetical protein [Haloprofundus salilacus]|uniref:hypothetical protein n=1 Tax=Haloprofundus salilacus TaxID=2876190 RepID=UPI001CCB6C60|nr:hypothetical protein [Haloprofundus salilacus]
MSDDERTDDDAGEERATSNDRRTRSDAEGRTDTDDRTDADERARTDERESAERQAGGDRAIADEAVEDGGVERRDLLKLGALTLAVGGGTAVGAMLSADQDREGLGPTESPPTASSKESTAESEHRALAEQFAPDLYFDVRELWYPTDPRRYISERGGETVVDGFDALDGYTKDRREAEAPPAPTVFYNVVDYRDSSLSVVQYWLYSAFDQFTTNFHWHDWELFQVFVNGDTGDPVLYTGSAHSKSVPNNEFVDPEADRPSVLSEVGSHASALGVNGRPRTFQRLAGDGFIADITNEAVEIGDRTVRVPAAYGLPRDEGLRIPYIVPELDGAPLYDHERLPNVSADDLLSGSLVVRNFAELANPPEDIPLRETGLSFGFDAATRDVEVEYDLVSAEDLRHIDGFTGPQLRFEFTVPKFVEDSFAHHLTATTAPREQPRFSDPVVDVTDPQHRATLAERYGGVDSDETENRVVGVVRELTTRPSAAEGETSGDESTADDEPPTDDELTPTNDGTVTTDEESTPAGDGAPTPPSLHESNVESVALLESENPTAVPTWNGVVSFTGVTRESHRLTVNGAGRAPYAETFEFDGGTYTAGVDGVVTVVPNEEAVKVRADASQQSGITNVRFEEDVAGPVYDGRPDGDDRFGIYVNRHGTYTAEVTDREGSVGVFRVTPGTNGASGDEPLTIDAPETGKRSFVTFLQSLLDEILTGVRDAVDELGPLRELLLALLRHARRLVDEALELVDRDDIEEAGEELGVLADVLRVTGESLDALGWALSGTAETRLRNQLEQARRRAEQAVEVPA